MLLDKIKSFALALALGLMATILAALALLRYVAARHSASLPDALAFAWREQVERWPADLLVAAALDAIVGIGFAALAWSLVRNLRWGSTQRKIDSPAAVAGLRARGTSQGKPRLFAGRYGGKPLHVSIEDRGLVIGPPGTGKTAFLLNQLLRASRDRLSFIAVDLKPELASTLSPSLRKAGYRVLRINPARDDPDADHWNPLDDIDDEIDINELCTALLPIRTPGDAPFVEAQRDWLRAGVFHVKAMPSGSLPAAFNLLSGEADPAKLLAQLTNSASPVAARLARRMAAGLAGAKPDPLILQGLTGCLRALDWLGLPGVQAALGHSDISVRELGKGDRPTALFLQFEEKRIGALGPLLAFMATGVLTSLIDTAGQREPVALLLDELGNMPPIPGLAEKLNTIRSRHIPTWMYFQTAEQINRRYGAGALGTFFASADVQIVFRLNDRETRELVSSLIGTTAREKHSQSVNGRAEGTTTTSTERGAVIEPHELGQLEPGQVVCLYRGAAAKGEATPHYIDFPAFRRK
ncbi:type IV secretory system conjugative DNA transfer family protein [Paraburkholderia kururiensis]|uniref:type IV secretory system conjugative DNA transfer family protein n=1 Tax=Paraburkholderia kururiensis TaxID=984307 RepID=UPI0005AB0142|nr:type IV secretory system conjugative DNA transfer family protein [Paraburkholderia kururiensis]